MASRKIFFGSKPSYIYPTSDLPDGNLNSPSSDHLNPFEFDEADVWNCNDQSTATTTIAMDAKKPLPSSRASSKKLLRKTEVSDRRGQMASASLPVNIPDWSKILKEEYREHGKSDEDVDDDDGICGGDDGADDHDGRVPPHEYLARRRGASFSVHEGIGRTLKGRDLRRVRNAIWKKTGFED